MDRTVIQNWYYCYCCYYYYYYYRPTLAAV